MPSRWPRNRWLGNPWLLLVALVLQILLGPVSDLTDLPLHGVLGTLVLLAAITVASGQRRDRLLGVVLGAPALVLSWIHEATGVLAVGAAAYVLTVALYLLVLQRLLAGLLRTQLVDAGTIARAVSSYLLLGAVWTLLYLALEQLVPGSFEGLTVASTGGPPPLDAISTDLFYFSFVTLTTLGYGDITPVTPLARSLATLEALAGTLFLAVLIAILVGKYAASARERA